MARPVANQLATRLRAIALRYPETYEEAPWGDRVVKVRGKIFFFCGVHEGKLALSVKLPQSARTALALPFARPTPYGLGKSGWVSCSFLSGERVDDGQISAWIEESYRAIAPKRLAAQLDAPAAHKPQPAAKRPKPGWRKRVVLICEDALRAQRAQRALAEHGIAIAVVPDVAALPARSGKRAPQALIIDLGRNQEAGLELAAEIDASDAEIFLFLVGIRDAQARRRAREGATSADLFGPPAGDAVVARAIANTLTRD
jgi:predicted DNA-binding protein (MmcQ/YjbR family)